MGSRMTRRLRTLGGLALVAGITLAGCKQGGSIAGTTAAATAEAFAAALEANDLKRAATAFDYVTAARQQNENWDDIPQGQRDLIVRKLVEAKAEELGQFRERLGGGIKVGPVANGGTVSLTGEAGSATLELQNLDGKWLIANLW